MSIIKNNTIVLLLNYCKDYPELYNKVANMLYENFQIRSAEVTLVVTYMVNEAIKADPA